MAPAEVPAPAETPPEAEGVAISWTPAAQKRLEKVPPFVRDFVRERTEAYVRGENRTEVTVEDLVAVRERRFGKTSPPQPR